MITRSDLKHFDKQVQDLLLWAQSQGARVRLTKNGHAFVYAPDGERTTTVPPKSKKQNRSGENTVAAVRRLFKKDPS